MGKKKRTNLVQLFNIGIKFMEAIQATLDETKQFLLYFYSKDTNTQFKHNPTDQDITKASYRFMKLEPGCGKEAIIRKYREMVKIIRPDLPDTQPELQLKKYTALRVAKDILIKIEK